MNFVLIYNYCNRLVKLFYLSNIEKEGKVKRSSEKIMMNKIILS